MKVRVISGYKAYEIKPLFEKYGKVNLISEEESSVLPTHKEPERYGVVDRQTIHITCIFEMSDEEGKTAMKALHRSYFPGTRDFISARNWG